jgi:hypothetical protein
MKLKIRKAINVAVFFTVLNASWPDYKYLQCNISNFPIHLLDIVLTRCNTPKAMPSLGPLWEFNVTKYNPIQSENLSAITFLN